MKNSIKYIIVVVAVILLVGGLVIFLNHNSAVENPPSTINMPTNNNENSPSIASSTLDSIVCGTTDPQDCKSDSDCICAAAETQYPGCFMGNKYYYEKCEDKSSSCFDACEGWGQPPVKCIKNRCTNRY